MPQSNADTATIAPDATAQVTSTPSPESTTSVPQFYFDLPPELIAQEPVRPRDAAIMFVLDRATQQRSERHVYDLPEFVTEGDVVVINDTRVIPAVLRGQRKNGGQIAIKLVSRKTSHLWDCLVESRLPFHDGEELEFSSGRLVGTVQRRNDLDTGYLIEFASSEGDVITTLESIGQFFHPLHLPSLKPGGEEILNTVYADRGGSFQSPSAGLHITPEVLDGIRARGADVVRVTQHVGRLDRPDLITGDRALEEHQLYEEWYEMLPEAADRINEAKAAGKRVFAIGTTSTRTLESCAVGPGRVEPASGWTNLFIKPGHQFQVVDALFSNFQSPMITTLILACAFGGTESVMEHYREAVRRRYRFLEYGDVALYL